MVVTELMPAKEVPTISLTTIINRDRPLRKILLWGHRILKPEAGRSKLDHKVYGRVYADGNIMEGYPAITEDNWAGGIQIETQPNTDGYT